MTIYSCEPIWEAMLTCIYEAWASGKGHENVKLVIEPIEQYTLFDEYIHVEPNFKKAGKVMDAVCGKLSYGFYHTLETVGMGFEEDAMDTIYRVMILGFAYGPSAMNMVQYKDVMRLQNIRVRVGKEINRFQEILRFHQVNEQLYVAHFEPKSRIIPALAPIFADRMPSEHWMIVDDVHMEAIVHPKDSMYHMIRFDEKQLEELLETEKKNDEFTDLWKAFFDAVAIEERKNTKCQNNMFPIWSRKHAVEFMQS